MLQLSQYYLSRSSQCRLVLLMNPFNFCKSIKKLLLNNIDVPAPFKYVISRSLFSHNISSLDDAIQLINIQTARDLIQTFHDNEEFPQFLNGARSLLAKEWIRHGRMLPL